MTVGPLEGLTSAVGDELTELAGFRSTRLTAQALPAQTVQTGVNTASSVDGTVITFPVATLGVGVLAGQRFILRSGTGNGQSLDILSVDSPMQVTLNGTLPVGAFSLESWEIQIDAETTFNVETTLDWPATGTVFVDGVRYIYGSKTLTTLDDLEHFDGVDFVLGVKQQHDPPAEVLDFTRDFSGLDITRRSFLVDFATGDDLSRLGANINVPRPPALTDDDIYRKLIKAIAYAPRGTIYAIEQALDALLGETVIDSDTLNATGTGDPTVIVIASGTFDAAVVEGMRFRITDAPENPDIEGRTVLIESVDSTTQVTLQIGLGEDFNNVSWEITDPNWEIFEDLTLGSINNTCTVFFRSINQAIDEFAGKTFLDGEELTPLTSTTTATLAQTPIRVAGARLAPEPGQFGVRKIDSGTASASCTGGPPAGALPITVTGPAATFDARIRPGDLFLVKSGSKAGQRATIQSRDSDQQLTMGPLRGQSQRQFDDTVIASGSFLNYDFPTVLEVFLSAGTFPPEVLVGMSIRVTGRTVAAGTGLGKIGEIAAISADRKTITLAASTFGFVDLIDVDWEVVIREGNGFTDADWEIVREVSDFRRYLPSEEEYIEYPGDAGTTIWTYEGTQLPENTGAVLADDPTDGEFLTLTRALGNTSIYRHPMRILPESRATLELQLSILSASAFITNGEQAFLRIEDGERDIFVGIVEDVGGTYTQIGFYSPVLNNFINVAGAITSAAAPVGNDQTITQTGGTFRADMVGRYITLYSGGSGTNHGTFLVTGFTDSNNIDIFNPNGILEIAGVLWTFGLADQEGQGTSIAQGRLNYDSFTGIKIVKDGRGVVKLYKNGHLIDFVEHSAFDSSTNRRIEFGAGDTATTTALLVRQVDWSSQTPGFDLWNAHIPRGAITNSGNNTPGELQDLDANGFFVAGDVTAAKRIRIRSTEVTGVGALGRNCRGEWELSTFTDADNVEFIGPTYSGARFDSSFGDRITIEDFPEAFIIPDMLGPNQQIEILTGPNAGTYDIGRFLELRVIPAVKATAQWTAVATASLADGQTIDVIDTQQVALTFEFNVSGSHVVAAGNFEVDVSGATTAADVAAVFAGRVKDAYNQGLIGMTAVDTGSLIDLTQTIPGSAGNTLVTTDTSFVVADFTDGEEETTAVRDLTENDDGVAFTTLERFTPLAGTAEIDFIQKTNIVEVSNPPAGGFNTSIADRWRLVPTFEPAGESTVELVDAGSIAGANMTFRQDLADHGIASGEVIAVERSLVLSAQVISPNDANDIFGSPPPDFDYYPFYLFDGFGFARTVVDFLTAAGVIPDFDRFFRDATGPHIIP